MSVEDLCRWRRLVRNRPMVDCSVRDHSDDGVRHPFPEHDILVVDVGLHLLLRLDVENLQCPRSYKGRPAISISWYISVIARTFESQNLLLRVHNGGVRSNRSPEDIISVCKVDDNDLVLFVDFLAHANEMVAFERQGLHGASIRKTRSCAYTKNTHLE